MRKIIYSTILLFFLSFPVLWGQKSGPVLRIFYSSSLNGNLDGCTCKSNPRSGLVKRSFFLRNLDNTENTLLLDAGDILDVMKDTLLADYIFNSYDELGYDAIALGEQEFVNGIEKLFDYRKNFPLYSHNLLICPDENSCKIFSLKPIIIKKKDFMIGIFSLFDPGLLRFTDPAVKDKVKINEPNTITGNMIFLLKESEVDIVICLFHGYYENAKALVRKIKGIDIVILGHEQQLIDMEKVEETIFVSPGKEGNQIGEMIVKIDGEHGLTFQNRFISFNYYSDPDDTSIRNKINEYYNKMKVK